jgi:hypothetical protein
MSLLRKHSLKDVELSKAISLWNSYLFSDVIVNRSEIYVCETESQVLFYLCKESSHHTVFFIVVVVLK